MKYFYDLYARMTEELRESDQAGYDFIQSVSDKMVEIDRKGPDALYDDDGNVWTKKGCL